MLQVKSFVFNDRRYVLDPSQTEKLMILAAPWVCDQTLHISLMWILSRAGSSISSKPDWPDLAFFNHCSGKVQGGYSGETDQGLLQSQGKGLV
jgi:hypothetical protein